MNRILFARLGCAIALLLLAGPAAVAGTMTVGATTVQNLVQQQLFTRSGRWYLQDDGGVCYAYLERPRTRLADGRIYMDAHLSSRLGQRLGAHCAGVEVDTNVRVSGKLRGHGSRVTLEDIRVDQVADEAAAGAIDLIRELAPEAIPNAWSIDVLAAVRAQPTSLGGHDVHLDQFKISDIVTRSDAIVVTFDLALSSP